MVTRESYNPIQVEAARSVIMELTHLLGEYRDSIVLIGGWIPELLLAGSTGTHTGSLDVDLALDHRQLKEAGYKTIQQLLLTRGYQQGKQPFIFHRLVRIHDQEILVQVDLLSGEYAGTSRSHRHQRIQDIQARKVRGCELAFEMPCEVTMHGELPDGSKDSVRVRLASIVPFLVMKGMALYDRLKEKDAWDIYYCLVHYPGGIDNLVEEFRPHLKNNLVREGLEKIAEKFASVDHAGPSHVASFEGVTEEEDRARIKRDAYERIHFLLEKLGIV